MYTGTQLGLLSIEVMYMHVSMCVHVFMCMHVCMCVYNVRVYCMCVCVSEYTINLNETVVIPSSQRSDL